MGDHRHIAHRHGGRAGERKWKCGLDEISHPWGRDDLGKVNPARSYVSMARPRRDRIELGEDERVVLERRARAEKLPFQDVLRARIVLYAADGVPDTEIARRLDSSPGLVGRWRRRAAS
jgi:Homeodomain-like domain